MSVAGPLALRLISRHRLRQLGVLREPRDVCTRVLQQRLVEAGLEAVGGVVIDARQDGADVDEDEGRPEDPRRDERDGDRHGRQRHGEGAEHPEGDRHGDVEQLLGDTPERDREPRAAEHHDRTQETRDHRSEIVDLVEREPDDREHGSDHVHPQHHAVLRDVLVDELQFARLELYAEEAAEDDVTEKVEKRVDTLHRASLGSG